jgi:hypothetical protein
MDLLFKDLLVGFKFIQDIFLGIRKFLTPARAYSWQTFIYLSLFSLGASYFAVGFVKDIIAFFGWIFLIAGTVWYTTDDPVRVPGTFMPVGALITGFLVSVFAFGHEVNVVTPKSIVFWPSLAAIITAIPEFFQGTGTEAKAQLPKLQVRQRLIILVAWSLLISCWLQFYFVVDNWLREYPSLLAGNFQKSAFVVRLEEKPKLPQNGSTILNKLQPLVEEQIITRPWSAVEKWLLDANQHVRSLGNQVITKNLAKVAENRLWRVEPRVTNVKSGYRLDILSIWTGPSENQAGFYLRKSCLIQPTSSGHQQDGKTVVADIQCDPLSKLVMGTPPPQQ